MKCIKTLGVASVFVLQTDSPQQLNFRIPVLYNQSSKPSKSRRLSFNMKLFAVLAFVPLAFGAALSAIPELVPRQAICSSPVRGNCDFYRSCLEVKYRCGATGYPLGYGDKYCRLFSLNKNLFTARGKTWMDDTMLCLQRALVPEATTVQSTCARVKAKAFDSHDVCYVNNGLCSLAPSDWLAILKIVDIKDLFGSWAAIKETLQSSAGCASFYLFLIQQGIGSIFD